MAYVIEKNISLAQKTTLGVGGTAQFFCEVSSEDLLQEVSQWAQVNGQKIYVLGSGSNVLVSDKGIKGLVIRLTSNTIQYTDDEDEVLIAVDAGVNWDSFVAEVVRKGMWGIENLSHIPGTVGAVPVQNVGAYGVEVKDVIESVRVYDSVDDKFKNFTNDSCGFSYRDSIFKQDKERRYIITNVTFRLKKDGAPNIEYKDIREYLHDEHDPSLMQIREAVIAIRTKKLPDWNSVGTAGSFFKNPIISSDEFTALKKKYPELPGFEAKDGMVKVSLGWILDHVCNLRGYREGNVGLYENQALVLVCKKGIDAKEIINFSEKIISNVKEKTGISIEREVNLI